MRLPLTVLVLLTTISFTAEAWACPAGPGWPRAIRPRTAATIPVLPEFRFAHQTDLSFSPRMLLRSRTDVDDVQALITLDGSSNVMVPSFPLRADETYDFILQDPFCGPECDQIEAFFDVVDLAEERPASPQILGAQQIDPWTVEPCHEDEILFSRSEVGRSWLHVTLDDVENLDDLRVELEVRFQDPGFGTERIVRSLPPTAETTFGPGAIIAIPDLEPSTDFSVAATLVAIDGTRSEITTFTGVTAPPGFACAPPDPGGPLVPGPPPQPGQVTVGAVQALSSPPVMLLGLLAFWRAHRWRRAGKPSDVRSRLRT